MNEFIHYDIHKPKRLQVYKVPRISAPQAFPPLLPEIRASQNKPLFNFMQKMGAYSATTFIATLPFISRLMHSSGTHIQIALTVFFVGSVLGELIAGPVSKIMGCKHIFLLGLAFYVMSAVVIRCSSVPGLLLAARVVQAIGAMASIAVTLYSFYTASPILPLKAIANPAGGFRHLFLILTAGIVLGGMGTRMGHIAFFIWTIPAAAASFFKPFALRAATNIRATAIGARAFAKNIGHRDGDQIFSVRTPKVAHIYARQEVHSSRK